MACASGVVQLVDKAPTGRKRACAKQCVLCKKSTGALHGTDEGREKLKTAAEILQDTDLLEILDEDSQYHSRTCHATYIKKAARAPRRDTTSQEHEKVNGDDFDAQDQDHSCSENCTSSNANLSADRIKRPRNEPNPQSIPKHERPCIICNSKRLRLNLDEVLFIYLNSLFSSPWPGAYI